MRFYKIFVPAMLAIALVAALPWLHKEGLSKIQSSDDDRLVIVWTSGDRDVAIKMVFMYAHASIKSKWWDRVKIIIWGPSSKLTSQDKEIQEYIKKMQDSGVEVVACKACADLYGVTPKLKDLGIEVKYMGKPLTKMVKDGWNLMTY